MRAFSPSADRPFHLEDLPVPQHRHHDVVTVLTQVVDTGDRHLDRLALEAGMSDPGISNVLTTSVIAASSGPGAARALPASRLR
jgi:hypothetical protein